jgi:hypothetical protein
MNQANQNIELDEKEIQRLENEDKSKESHIKDFID